MKNQIIKLGVENRKTFGFNDDQIMISSKYHRSFTSLLAASQQSGMFNYVTTIAINSIQEIKYNEKSASFKIAYENDKGVLKRTKIIPRKKAIIAQLVAQLASLSHLNKSVKKESKIKPLLWNTVVMIGIAIMTWIARGMVVDIQHKSDYYVVNGSNGIKQHIINIAEIIGPNGITVIGLIGLVYMVSVAFRRYKQPANEVFYNLR